MNPQASDQLPPQMSTLAPQVDALYYLLYDVSLAAVAAIIGAMVFFVVQYRRRPGVAAQLTGHNNALEVAWTVAPVFLLAYLFHAGWQGYVFGAVAPSNALEIHVTGKQWTWDFTHMPSGAQESNSLTVPVHQPVRLIMSSADVLHSFFVPAFRVKRDVVPGMYTTLWFEATHVTPEEEPLTIFCAEYCGAPAGISAENSVARSTNHSTMLATLRVTTREGYAQHLGVEDGSHGIPDCVAEPDPMACWGERLSREMGCMGCHNTDGSESVGPTWRGLWGSTRTFVDGTTRVADEHYLTQSIVAPQSQVVQGFTRANMPVYAPTENRRLALIAYIRSLAVDPL
ncbi:MAG: cytochrome c oxidase subunit II [Sandaracinaceae bacterium]|nr:cytochrome c oxidase subunit II [Sandaracinaceae bacterium]